MDNKKEKKKYAMLGYIAFTKRKSDKDCPIFGNYHDNDKKRWWLDGWMIAAGLIKVIRK